MVLSERSESKGFMIDGRYGNQMPVYYVYILRTLDNTLYIGVTETLDQRINTHNSGKGAEWIKAHPNAHLVYFEPYAALGALGSAKSRSRSGREPRRKRLLLEIS
jgi:putative endonuclease